MFSLFGRTPKSEAEIAATKLLETLKAFRGESAAVRNLFVQQAAVLHANFLGKYKSVENFKTLSEDEKGHYFLSSIEISDSKLKGVPAIKLAYLFYSLLITMENAGNESIARKLRGEFASIRGLGGG